MLINNIYDFVLFKNEQTGQNHAHEALLPSVITFNLYYGIWTEAAANAPILTPRRDDILYK